MLKQDSEALLARPVDVIRLWEAMNPRQKARIEREAVCVCSVRPLPQNIHHHILHVIVHLALAREAAHAVKMVA